MVLNKISLVVNDGDFFTLLGPSGCGKTTLLWLLAGFNSPQSGKIWFGDRDVTRLKTEKRRIGIVFQNYALFPHMSVEANIKFGLTGRELSKPAIDERATESLEMVGMESFRARRPHELSGGQQQRVALARAIATRPDVLLMDEPLSNLDAALRLETRARLRELQQRLKITTIYVTHDQEEALTQSDQLAIMNEGHIVQLGTPQEVYERPTHKFAASFLGRCNFIPIQQQGENYVTGAEYEIEKQRLQIDDAEANFNTIAIRPEKVQINQSIDHNMFSFEADLVWKEYLGDRYYLKVKAPEFSPNELLLSCSTDEYLNIKDNQENKKIKIAINPADLRPLAK
jgi:ABC-type Fe3+/spermidine/putrescine transport system ATPase subunit